MSAVAVTSRRRRRGERVVVVAVRRPNDMTNTLQQRAQPLHSHPVTAAGRTGQWAVIA